MIGRGVDHGQESSGALAHRRSCRVPSWAHPRPHQDDVRSSRCPLRPTPGAPHPAGRHPRRALAGRSPAVRRRRNAVRIMEWKPVLCFGAGQHMPLHGVPLTHSNRRQQMCGQRDCRYMHTPNTCQGRRRQQAQSPRQVLGHRSRLTQAAGDACLTSRREFRRKGPW